MTVRRKLLAGLLVGVLALVGAGCGDGDDGDYLTGVEQAEEAAPA